MSWDKGRMKFDMNKRAHVDACVTRSFSQSPAAVFDACISPELLSQWMFAPSGPDEEIVHISIDPKVGGSFSFLLRRKGLEIDHAGKFLEITRPHRLLFTWSVESGDSSRVSIDIVPKGSGCELTLIHELSPDWADTIGRTEESWEKKLGALASTLNGRSAHGASI